MSEPSNMQVALFLRFNYFIVSISLVSLGLSILHSINHFSLLPLFRGSSVTHKVLNLTAVVNTSYRIWLDGYNLQPLATYVFDDGVVHSNASDFSNFMEGDLRLLGMHGKLKLPTFKGTTLTLNGESYGAPVSSEGNVYLGPCAEENDHNLQFYYVQFAALLHGREKLNSLLTAKRRRGDKFLAYLQSNCVEFREKAFDDIVQYFRRHHPLSVGISAYGRCHGSHPETKDQMNTSSQTWVANIEILPHRFHLAMENTRAVGYVTEKIINAFLMGGIPIYFGTTEVFNLFNKKAFIFYNISDPDKSLAEILRLELNKTSYDEMLLEPIFAEGAVRKYFSLWQDIEGGWLRSKIRKMVGLDSSIL